MGVVLFPSLSLFPLSDSVPTSRDTRDTRDTERSRGILLQCLLAGHIPSPITGVVSARLGESRSVLLHSCSSMPPTDSISSATKHRRNASAVSNARFLVRFWNMSGKTIRLRPRTCPSATHLPPKASSKASSLTRSNRGPVLIQHQCLSPM